MTNGIGQGGSDRITTGLLPVLSCVYLALYSLNACACV